MPGTLAGRSVRVVTIARGRGMKRRKSVWPGYSTRQVGYGHVQDCPQGLPDRRGSSAFGVMMNADGRMKDKMRDVVDPQPEASSALGRAGDVRGHVRFAFYSQSVYSAIASTGVGRRFPCSYSWRPSPPTAASREGPTRTSARSAAICPGSLMVDTRQSRVRCSAQYPGRPSQPQPYSGHDGLDKRCNSAGLRQDLVRRLHRFGHGRSRP